MSDCATSWQALSWHCKKCNCVHKFTSKRALIPFKKGCGYQFSKTSPDGDCFFSSIGTCTNHAVSQLRGQVSDNCNENLLEMYRMLATVGGEEYDWAMELKKSGCFKNTKTLKKALRMEGSLVGRDGCIWADSFAIAVVGEMLDLNILVVDMPRSKNTSPYRFLHRASTTSRYVVLKFQRLHYQPLLYNGEPIYALLADLPKTVRTLWEL